MVRRNNLSKTPEPFFAKTLEPFFSKTIKPFFENRFKVEGSRSGDILFLMMIGLLIFTAGWGLRDPWPADEPRFALVAKEMVNSGQWFFPRRGGELYPDKPPLFMWAIALFYFLTGSMRFSFLMPSILSGLGTLLLVYDLGFRLWNRRIGLWAGLALLAILQFSLQVRSAQIDASLCFWTTLGLYGLLRHLLRGPDWRWYFLGWFAMGIGIITKGVGFLPVFVLIPYLFSRFRSWKKALTIPKPEAWKWAIGPVFLLIAASLWFVPMILLVSQSHDPALIAYKNNILWHQTADRLASSWHHIKPFWYYIFSVMPWAWFPFTIAAPWLLPAWRRRLLRKDLRFFFLLGWIGLVILFFSLSPGKRGVYLLPASPALALSVAPLMPGLFKKASAQKTAWYLTCFLGCLLVFLSAVGGLFETPLSEKVAQFGVNPWGWGFFLGLLGLGQILYFKKNQGFKVLSLFLLTLWLFYGWVGYPLYNPVQSPANFMVEIGRKIGTDAELAIVNFREQLILQADRPIVHFGYHQEDKDEEVEAARWLREKKNRWILLPERNLSRCFSNKKAAYLGHRHRNKWFLVNQEALRTTCVTTQKPVNRYRSNQVRG